MKNKPTLTNSNRDVHMAVFKQTKENGATWFSTTLKRPYKNRQGQWEHGSYNLKQLEALVELAQEAIQFITESEKQNQSAEQSAAA
jgi:hypothetical protein